MKSKFELVEIINSTPELLFSAWLNSEKHSEMTGGAAVCTSEVGAEFTAWDGYISGTNLELVENQLIVQSWRTSEFSDNDEDSILKIEFKSVEKGTEIKLSHSNIPEGNASYKEGWIEHYFNPMNNYFGKV